MQATFNEQDTLPDNLQAPPAIPQNKVTFRSFLVGLIFCSMAAALNCWLATVYNAHMIGGIQMPFVSLAVLLFFVLVVNILLRAAGSLRFLKPFTGVELMVLYSMMLFGALISTPGCDNVFLTTGATLFYYGSPENKWASLFYQHVPTWFAPGWDGARFQTEVIAPLYLGGLSFAEIPWHAWTAMVTAWSIFLGFVYALMFFTALIFRKPWIEHESLPFPLVEVPLQMIETSNPGETPPGEFWKNSAMWAGLCLALFIHIFKGMNSAFPDWPIFPVNAFNPISISFTERPWNVIGTVKAELFLGGIGLAYLLTREISFSFWFFYLFFLSQAVMSEMAGFPAAGMNKPGGVNFILSQSTGGWFMMAALLIWTAREYLMQLVRAACGRSKAAQNEPFSPQFMLGGFLFSLIGLLGWSWFAGINLMVAIVFLGIFMLTSLVLSRLVIEGGFMFPQAPFLPLNTMMGGLMSSEAMGAASLTKLSFVQPMIAGDMRTNILPAFMGVMKIAHETKLERTQLRRLLLCCLAAIAVTFAVTIVVSLASLYSAGGLQAYSYFSFGSATANFKSAAGAIQNPYPVNTMNTAWMIFGAAMVWLMMASRSRFLWFPLHPLGYLVAPGYAIKRLWFSFFLGWVVKTLIMKYGGSDNYLRARPFMIGLILGNAIAMIFWMAVGFYTGSQTTYWPA